MITASTLVELLHANARNDRSIVYVEGDRNERAVTYAQLMQRALGVLFHLQRLGARRGDKLILFLNNNQQFIEAFWAGVLGGIVPVPVALGISDEHRHKLLRIARKLGHPFLYTDAKTLERVREFAHAAGEQSLFTALGDRTLLADEARELGTAGQPTTPQPNDPLFIQFSSGSTSEPKGVLLTHANILANARGSGEAAGFNDSDVSVSWMPLTHDMGLVGLHLIMFAHGVQQYLMPTELFIRRPLLWMETAARARATITCSPNFGYRHFLKVLGERSVEQWDLSSLRLIFNGAEPISVELCDEFMQRMAAAKLKRSAMFPVYGLAEASLAVSFPQVGSNYHFRTFDRHHLSVGEQCIELARGARDAVDLVAVGKPIPYCNLRLVDDADRSVSEARVGHIHIRGENVTQGYFEDPATNAEAITADGWLRTGDLGLELAGELYITGRAKDIIFVNGQNYYPHDLEAIAQQAPGLELNKVVVAAVRKPTQVEDEIAVFVLHRGELPEFLATADDVARLINERAGLEVAYALPVKRIPKTTSGKLQRHLLVAAFQDGEFDAELQALQKLRAHADATPMAADASTIERQLKAICDAVITDRAIGIGDNLFDVGVSSLKLVSLHEAIDREFPGELDLTEIFEHASIAALAQHLEAKRASQK